MTKLYIALLLTLCASNTLQHIPQQQFQDVSGKKINANTSPKSEPEESPMLKIESSKPQSEKTNVSKENKLDVSGNVKLDNRSNSYVPSIEPGADLRLISVISLIALSCLLCVCFKMYR